MRHRILLVLLLLALSSGAQAMDLISYPTSAASDVPVAPANDGYDWQGFYAGVFGAYQHSSGADRFGLGVDAGVNTTFNFVLAGAEVAVTGLGDASGQSAMIEGLGRAGVLLTDSLLAYGAAGYGIDTKAPSDGDVLVGGGLDSAVSSDLSLRAQYLRGMPVTGADARDRFTLGAQFHF